MALLAELIDSFTAPSLNTSLWTAVTGGGAVTVDTVNDRATVACPTSTGVTNSLGTAAVWDGRGNAQGTNCLYAQVIPVPKGSGGTFVQLVIAKDASNSVAIQLTGGQSTLQLAMKNAGVTTTASMGTYDLFADGWWRLRELSGTWYADTSPDGFTWTQQASLASSWSAAAVSVAFQTSVTVTETYTGLSASIAHVNTPAGGLNPGWPAVEHAWGPYWNANGGDSPLDKYVDLTARTRGAVSVSRGRQYELDQVRSGELQVQLENKDGSLDPSNASGPWAGRIMPYQPYRIRAQWPPTPNLLTQVQATAGDLGGIATGAIPGGSAGIDVFTNCDTSGGSMVASATAWQGGRAFQFQVPSSTASTTAICFTSQPAVERSITYSLQMRVRNITPSTTVQVDAFLSFSNTAGTATVTRSATATLTGSATAAWTLITVTATAPADAARLSCGVETAATAAATCSVQVDGWQLERGPAATPWICPGTMYPVYAGFAERYPQSWTMSGTYGTVSISAADAFSLLSQRQLRDPLTEEMNRKTPRFLYTLNDPAGSSSATDVLGNPPAPVITGKYGAGSLLFGAAITATDPVNGIYTGSSGSVATISNSNPGTGLTTGGATVISLAKAGIKGPADPSSWTRMIAFRYTGPTITAASYLWTCLDSQRNTAGPSGSRIWVYLDTAGRPNITIGGPTLIGGNWLFGGATNCVDGNWHLLIFGYNQATQQVLASQDGTTAAFYGSIPTATTPTGLISDAVGGYVDPTVGNGTTWNYKGDIAYAAEFGWVFTTGSEITSMYAAWKNSCAGDSTDVRYGRILKWGGYLGPSSIQTGLTRSMGPAATDGQDVLSALQATVDTEGGEHFVDRVGTVTFRSRGYRYNSTVPSVVFGERVDLGEVPYEETALDYDPTHLANQVTVTQASTGQTFSAQDATSITDYFPRTLSRTINSSDAGECQDAAGYLLSRYKQPAARIPQIRLHPSASPGLLWPVCLSLELGTRVRVKRRPPRAPEITVDCFVESIQWGLDDNLDATVTMQCSPVDSTPYGMFAALHTTLASAASSGVSTVTLAAWGDTTNPAATQLGQGQQLVLGLGTANQETVTVLSVGSTSPSWSTVAVTLQAATTKAHASGDVVCEPLPAGTTNAAAYDASSALDAVAFSY
ncbi:hypothetical protein [Streptacidiphilus griseoplanus]|uniref:hypothetical protein n=1 Tax=Peterkaempfera griseoplana TaxID=66896 RepID=UPI000A526E70|nr:hypothetical protein [Peterkaempfera griseoplana]